MQLICDNDANAGNDHIVQRFLYINDCVLTVAICITLNSNN